MQNKVEVMNQCPRVIASRYSWWSLISTKQTHRLIRLGRDDQRLSYASTSVSITNGFILHQIFIALFLDKAYIPGQVIL